jgi:hypothetical protein
MHLNFAAQPEALGSFFKPACSKPALAGSRA